MQNLWSARLTYPLSSSCLPCSAGYAVQAARLVCARRTWPSTDGTRQSSRYLASHKPVVPASYPIEAGLHAIRYSSRLLSTCYIYRIGSDPGELQQPSASEPPRSCPRTMTVNKGKHVVLFPVHLWGETNRLLLSRMFLPRMWWW